MKLEEEKELENLKHKNKIEELAFVRETELMAMEKSWELSVRPTIQQQQPQQPVYGYPQPPQMPEVPEPSMQEQSMNKYGGK